MGIHGFQKWLLASFPEIVRVQGSRFGQQYDHVAFDMNQIIHTAARRATDRQALAITMFRELDQILKNCVPRKSIFFAFDGPGPLAKLLTQRKRRSKAKKEQTNISPMSSRRTRYARPTIDRLGFTPGVDLQYFVRDAVEYWAYSRLQNDSKYKYIDIRISGSDVAGEGELKLIDFCRAANLPPTDSIVVVGGDADIVLQGLATVPIRNFFVYLRHFGGGKRKRLNYVISVWELARTLEKLFPQESSGARLDFILFSILNGNDYIPKLRGVTLGRLWKRYVSLKSGSNGKTPPFKGQCVVDAENRTFNWVFFHALVDNVGLPVRSLETEFAMEGSKKAEESENKKDSKNGKPQAYLYFDSPEEGEELGETILYNGNEDGIPMDEVEKRMGLENNNDEIEDGDGSTSDEDWEASSDIIGEEEVEDEEEEEQDDDDDYVIDEDEQHIETLVAISGDSKKYFDLPRWVRTLLWTLQMYIDGYCSDFSFQYGKPYGPSFEALAKYINDHNGDPFVLQAPVSDVQPLLPHQAALAMLPRHAIHLLPKPLQKLVEDPIRSKDIFQPNHTVNVPAMLRAIADIPQSEYTSEEQKRMVAGKPFLLRRPRAQDRVGRTNPDVPVPGSKFEAIQARPFIFRKVFTVTDSPPCYSWPQGSFQRMLELPYIKVGGGRLPGYVQSDDDANENDTQAVEKAKADGKGTKGSSGPRTSTATASSRGRGHPRRRGRATRGRSSRTG